jgi:hypothetical protein
MAGTGHLLQAGTLFKQVGGVVLLAIPVVRCVTSETQVTTDLTTISCWKDGIQRKLLLFSGRQK